MKHLIIAISLLTSMTMITQAQITDPKLEVVASFDKAQPIGVSVSSNNRVFVSFPNKAPYTMGLSEIENGERVAFPNTDWQDASGMSEDRFVNVQDIYVDTKDYLWVLDSKPASSSSIFANDGGKDEEGRFRLYGFDLKTNKLNKRFDFPSLDKKKSALNDVRVDTDKNLAYLSDPGLAGIVVLNLENGESRTVLSNTKYTLADTSLVLSYEGRNMRDKQGKPFRSNVNGIALTKDNKWFYFKPINATHLYRIETKYLADEKLKGADLEGFVEDLGEVGITHGLVADVKGNIYLTTSLDYTVKRLTPEGKLEVVTQDSRVLWPDSMGVGSDGYLYFSCAQMQLLPNWNNGQDLVQYPYQVYRVKVL